MTKAPESDTFLSPDEAARDSLFHPVLLALINGEDVDFTGIATIEFLMGAPNTRLPFKLLPATRDRFVMALVAHDRAEFVEDLDDFALWTPRYAEFFELPVDHPMLLLDAFAQ